MLLSAGPISSSPISAAAGDNLFDTAFPLFTSQLVVTLDPWEGTTFPLLSVHLGGTIGPSEELDVTFPLLFSILGNPAGSFSISFPLWAVNLYAAAAIKAGSGLYQLKIGDTHDTYYAAPTIAIPGSNVGVKIPDPTIQTYLAHDDEENVIHIAGYRIRAVGSGNLQATLYTMDSVRNQSLANVAMTTTNAREPMILANFSSQRAMLKVFTSAIDEKFDVNRILLFVKELYKSKPM